MGAEMVSYPAFFDELSKIAEANQPPKPEDMTPEERKKYVTKRKLIRLAKVVGAAGAGAGLGTAAGIGASKLLRKYRPQIMEKIQKHKLQKWLPPVAGGLAAGTGMLLATKDKKVKQYIEQDDEGKRPEQHRS
jgi:hypothetical protein